MDRRRFLTTGTTTAAGLSFLGLHRYLLANQDTPRTIAPYGPLIPDPNKLLDLPKGFNYRIISRKGELMNDGYSVPRTTGWHGSICRARWTRYPHP